jgi:hypothetical protein
MRSVDALDIDGATSAFAPNAEVLTVYGREGKGLDQARAVLTELFEELRGVDHQVTSEWNPEPGVWIAEVTATYVLKDFSRRGPYLRVIVLRVGDAGIEQLRIYGSREPPFTAEGGYQEVLGPHGWLPTL